MFAVIFICENLFLRIAEKVQELAPAKISCHTVLLFAILKDINISAGFFLKHY